MRRRTWVVLSFAAALAVALTVSGDRLAASQTSTIVAMRAPAPVPWQEPWDSFWRDVPTVPLPLSAQEAVPPKGGQRLTLRAGAVHDGETMFLILEWPDPTATDSASRTQDFTDAAAVQFPAAAGVGVPALCMGAPGAEVNIWQWRAAWQAQIEEGAPPSTAVTYPNTVVDSYPFSDEEVFQPGRALGNPISALGSSTTDNLVAGGFGTLTSDPLASVEGWGRWRNGVWRVVVARPLEVGREGNVELVPGSDTDLAFAVWDGAAEERDGMKSVSTFARLEISEEALPAGVGPIRWILLGLLVAPLVVWLGLRAGRPAP